MLVAWVADLPAEPGPATALALSVLVGSAIRKLPTRPAGVVTAAGFVLVAASWIAFPSASSAIPNVTVLNGAAWLTAIAAGLGLRLLDTRRQATIDVIRRDERLELARELHDVVAHHITGIVLQSQAAQLVAHTQPRTTLADSFAGIEVSGSEALAAMRRVVGLLRDADDAAPTTSVPEQLEDLVNRFNSHGPKVHLHAPDGEPPWTPELTSTVYRIVQESLTNVARHAPDASSVAVSITQDHQTITVEVVDDAPSVSARHHHRDGFGLIGMRERVEALGGSLQAGPRAVTGWSVLANLPAPPPEAR
nr:histidine kinase [Phytoactinopolyspora mesophila]